MDYSKPFDFEAHQREVDAELAQRRAALVKRIAAVDPYRGMNSLSAGIEGGPSARLVEERRLREQQAAAQRPPAPDHWADLVAEAAATAAGNASVRRAEWLRREQAEQAATAAARWNR